MIKEELCRRGIPSCFALSDGSKVITIEEWKHRRDEIKDLLRHEFMGYEPIVMTNVKGIIKTRDEKAFAGKAVKEVISIEVTAQDYFFSFPCYFVLPKHVKKSPVFLYLSFSPDLVDEFLPVEEIIDQGFAVASFYYQDIVPDIEDHFRNGLAGISKRNPYESWGKISMWSWAASRVMDYLQTLDTIDKKRIAIVGHSRLGKTALWCGANDERFSLVAANDSGAGGAALFRGKTGEKIEDLVKYIPYWFCGNFARYRTKEELLPFDQHFLLALVVPRNLYICSAREDDWSDPESEFLSCAAAGEVYELFGKNGLVTKDQYPEVNQVLNHGNIGYHLRSGEHYFSRYDWQKIIEYRNMDIHKC